MPNALPLDQNIPAGSLISLPISYFSLTFVTRLKPSEIVSACADTGNFSASSFSYDYTSGVLSESGVLYGTVSADDDGNDIIQQISRCLNGFKTVVGLNISEIDSASSTAQPTIGETISNKIGKVFTSIDNTITAEEQKAAAAVKNVENTVITILIILVIGLIFLSQSKNIKIGI